MSCLNRPPESAPSATIFTAPERAADAAAAPRASARTASANLAEPVYPVLRELDMLAGFLVAGSGRPSRSAKVMKASSSRLSGKRVRKVSPSYGSSQPCREGQGSAHCCTQFVLSTAS